jgi:hypothetical protein
LRVARIAFQEKANFRPGKKRRPDGRPFRFQVSPGILVVHDAARADIRRAEARPGKCVKTGLGFCRSLAKRVWKVTMGERAEVAIRSMPFRNQEPVQRRIGIGGLQRAGEPAKSRGKSLVSPIAMMDDRIARIDRAALRTGGGEVHYCQRGKAAQGRAFAQIDDPILGSEILCESLRQRSVVVRRIQRIHIAHVLDAEFSARSNMG